MTRRKKNPLRELTKEERMWLERITRSHSEPAGHVARAKEILAVANGETYTQAAKSAGHVTPPACLPITKTTRTGWSFWCVGAGGLEPPTSTTPL